MSVSSRAAGEERTYYDVLPGFQSIDHLSLASYAQVANP